MAFSIGQRAYGIAPNETYSILGHSVPILPGKSEFDENAPARNDGQFGKDAAWAHQLNMLKYLTGAEFSSYTLKAVGPERERQLRFDLHPRPVPLATRLSKNREDY